MKDYEAYFEEKDDVKVGEMVIVSVKDRDTFEEISVKAIISDKKEDFSPDEYDNLWVEFGGNQGINREQWYVKVLEEVEEEVEDDVVIVKKTRVSMGERRGFMIRSMIEEREKKDK